MAPIKAVNDVSLTVDDGEFVALVGPSGCGKTTTLNLVAGLIPITAGEISIGDRVVNDVDPKDRDIAMVFQNYALYPQKTVYKNLAFPLQMRRLPRDEIDRKVREAARVLDMTHLLERKPRELSGGQQQRVALGRALVRDPAVFLMDEPLSNLDAKLRVQMRSEIKRFHQDLKATIIYVTHDQLEAVTMADKMAVMNGGFLQQYDSPAQVFANPVNMFVASFIGSPAMSLVPLEASTVDGRTVLTGAEGWTMALSPLNTRKVQRVDHEEDCAWRAPLDNQAYHPCGSGRDPRQGLYRGTHWRCDLRTGVAVRVGGQHKCAAQRRHLTGRADLARVRPGAHAPVRWCNRNGPEGRLRQDDPMRPASLHDREALRSMRPTYPVWVGTRNQLRVMVEIHHGIADRGARV